MEASIIFAIFPGIPRKGHQDQEDQEHIKPKHKIKYLISIHAIKRRIEEEDRKGLRRGKEGLERIRANSKEFLPLEVENHAYLRRYNCSR